MNFSTHILTRRMTDMKENLMICKAFQLTSSQGGWLIDIALRNPEIVFQLTSSQGGWLMLLFVLLLVLLFQLTSSQGGWPWKWLPGIVHILFNSHPHKEDDHLLPSSNLHYSLFNSHPHKEDDLWNRIWYRQIDFSTHILTRRMTATLNKNTLSKTARIIPFEYNTLKIYIFSNSYLLFFWKSTPFSGANLPENFCALIIRTKISKYP